MSWLCHYGVSKENGAPGRGSGRYPKGSGKNKIHSVFISGSSKTQDPNSAYYRKKLPNDITKSIDSHIRAGHRILVGDAPGIDRQVQNYIKQKGYNNVVVYGPGKTVRYLADKKWPVKTIDAPEFEPGSKEWLAKKDIAMNNAADEGLAVILDEGSSATRKNIERFIMQNKPVSVYQLSGADSSVDKWINSYLKDVK